MGISISTAHMLNHSNANAPHVNTCPTPFAARIYGFMPCLPIHSFRFVSFASPKSAVFATRFIQHIENGPAPVLRRRAIFQFVLNNSTIFFVIIFSDLNMVERSKAHNFFFGQTDEKIYYIFARKTTAFDFLFQTKIQQIFAHSLLSNFYLFHQKNFSFLFQIQ